MTELIDLSTPLRNDGMEAAAIEIDTLDHATTARRLARRLGVTVEDLGLDGLFVAEERVTVGTHYGTHLDAPLHYGDEVAGRPALSVDEVPLDLLFAEAVLLDFADGRPGPITAGDLAAAYEAIGVAPAAGQMLITRVGIEDDYLVDPTIRERGAGLDASAIEWLIERDVRLTATDSMTQDMPIPWMEERLKAGNRDAYFPVHLAGQRYEYVHVEKAWGLRSLPAPAGYRVAPFPVKVEGGSGAWTRFHAIIDPPFNPASVRVVDLSQPIRRESMEPDPPEVVTHGAARRRRQWAKHLRMRVDEIDERGSWDQVRATTVAGTHVQAPYRFAPSTQDREARTIDEVPLEWCFGPAIVLDVSGGPRSVPIDREELLEALSRTGGSLSGGEIVMFHTGAAKHFDGDPAFAEMGRGLAVDALEYLVGRGVVMIGTDAESLDRPLSCMVKDRRSGNRDALYPIHRAARHLEFCAIPKLSGLGAVPNAGWWASVAPVKIEGAGSAWCRAVGYLPRKDPRSGGG